MAFNFLKAIVCRRTIRLNLATLIPPLTPAEALKRRPHTTELFRGREMPKCGPTDDACCDQFSPSVTRHKGGGYNMGHCVQAGCSGSPVFNFHPVPGRPLPSFDGGQFPQGHCVPKQYRPKPGDANSPARAKREAATTSLGSDDTTELRGMKCGPTDDACCD